MLTKPNILGYYGSYLYVRFGGIAFFDLPNDKKENIVICTNRGTAVKSPNCFVIKANETGKVDFNFNRFTYQYEEQHLAMTFADERTLVLEGEGIFTLDEMPAGFTDNAVKLKKDNVDYYIVNVYRNKTKYLVYALNGQLQLEKSIHGDEYAQSSKGLKLTLNIKGTNGFKVIIQEIPHNMCAIDLKDYDFETCASEMLEKFVDFYRTFEKPMKETEDVYKLAVYHNWSQTLKASGHLTRNFIKCANYLTGNWCSDIVLNATGLMQAQPRLAYDQIAVFFDKQDEYGCIPGSMNDEQLSWNISKAPFALSYIGEILKYYHASKEEKDFLYERMGKLIEFYLTYRDSNHDGICEYLHGNESDCDNSSCYEDFEAIDSPELTAYLVNGMDFLYELGTELKKEDASAWKEKADSVAKTAIDYFFVNDKVVCRFTNDGTVKDSDSAMPLYFLLMGKRLPEDKVVKVVDYVKKNFVGEYGAASEGFGSKKYATVFRGPTYIHNQLLVDGLDRCGYHDLAKEIACGYVKGIIEAETFDQFDARDMHRTCMITKEMMVSTVAAVFIYFYNKFYR